MAGNSRLSVIPSRAYGGLPDRAPSMMANPVARQPASKWTRETAPMLRSAGPRILHPKLNLSPWSTSMAVKQKTHPKVKRSARKMRKG